MAGSVTSLESGNDGRRAAPVNKGGCPRKLLTDKELEEHQDDSTRGSAAAIENTVARNAAIRTVVQSTARIL
jgi:hypothetical protein